MESASGDTVSQLVNNGSNNKRAKLVPNCKGCLCHGNTTPGKHEKNGEI